MFWQLTPHCQLVAFGLALNPQQGGSGATFNFIGGKFNFLSGTAYISWEHR